MRDSAIMYRSFYESGQCLPEAERLKLYEAIFEYSFNGKVIELDGIAKPILMLIMPLLEANMKRYENGKKPKQKQKTSKKEAKPKRTRSKAGANVYVNKDKNVNENENENKETYGFDDFWKAYPNKVNKITANKSWVKLAPKDQKDAVVRLPLFLKTVSEPKYIPYPATYLNNKRWQDEGIEIKPATETPVLKKQKCVFVREGDNRVEMEDGNFVFVGADGIKRWKEANKDKSIFDVV